MEFKKDRDYCRKAFKGVDRTLFFQIVFKLFYIAIIFEAGLLVFCIIFAKSIITTDFLISLAQLVLGTVLLRVFISWGAPDLMWKIIKIKGIQPHTEVLFYQEYLVIHGGKKVRKHPREKIKRVRKMGDMISINFWLHGIAIPISSFNEEKIEQLNEWLSPRWHIVNYQKDNILQFNLKYSLDKRYFRKTGKRLGGKGIKCIDFMSYLYIFLETSFLLFEKVLAPPITESYLRALFRFVLFFAGIKLCKNHLVPAIIYQIRKLTGKGESVNLKFYEEYMTLQIDQDEVHYIARKKVRKIKKIKDLYLIIVGMDKIRIPVEDVSDENQVKLLNWIQQ